MLLAMTKACEFENDINATQGQKSPDMRENF
jgi:hypothetical protein